MSDKQINVAVLGASGRMGQAIIREMMAGESLVLSGALVSESNEAMGQDAGHSQNINTAVALSSDPGTAIEGADVAIDISLPEATDALIAACIAAACPLVIGTTGLNDEQLARIEAASEQIPILLAANFSKGVCVLAALLEETVRVLGPDWDAEIGESHHRGKKDIPSGTALALGEQIAAARGRTLADLVSYRTPESGPLPAGRIGMHSTRAGDMAGEHRIVLAGKGEQLELLHRATDRAAFARGALDAAAWLAGQKPGLYGMAEVFGL